MAGRPATERLFDVLMKRFDAWRQLLSKDGVGAILRSLPVDDPEAILLRKPLTLPALDALDAFGYMRLEQRRPSSRSSAPRTRRWPPWLSLHARGSWLRDDSEDIGAHRLAVRSTARLRRLLVYRHHDAPAAGSRRAAGWRDVLELLGRSAGKIREHFRFARKRSRT